MLAVTTTIAVPFLQGSILPESYPSGIMHFVDGLTRTDVARIVVSCGILETVLVSDPKDMPGDYGTGYFSIRDKGLNEDSLVSELENGRLAMLAFVSQFIAEFLTGGESWE